MGRDLRFKKIKAGDDRECVDYDWCLTYRDVNTEWIDCSRHNDKICSGRFTKEELKDELQRLACGDDEAIEAAAVIAKLIKEVPLGGWLVVDYS